jgi:hypothetical protein
VKRREKIMKNKVRRGLKKKYKKKRLIVMPKKES